MGKIAVDRFGSRTVSPSRAALTARLAPAAIAALLLAIGSRPAQAQSASQITPKTFAPPQQGPLESGLHMTGP